MIPPAVVRLRRARWITTVFFTLATAVCLVVLAGVAIDADARSRLRESDAHLAAAAVRYSKIVYYGAGSFDLGTFGPTTLDAPNQPVGFVDGDGVEVAFPDQKAMPNVAVVTRLTSAAHRYRGSVFTTASGPSGVPYRWVATPMSSTPDGPAVIVGASLSDTKAHDDFVRLLIAAVIGLTFFAALGGHLLSGRGMKPALRALTQQEQFLREAAHELRTPVAALTLTIQQARAEPGTASATLQRAESRLTSMATLIDGLLMRARADAGHDPVPLTRIRLDQLVDVVLDDYPDHHIPLETTPTVVLGNGELLTQALRNLVDNALKYSGDTPSVQVRDATLTVTDHGPGIPTAQRRLVRQAGYGSSEGTGTGLAIVEWIATVHHTHLQLDTPPEGGLRATLRFHPPQDENTRTAS